MSFSSHPLVLAARFVLELCALWAFARFGFQASQGPMRYVWAVALPLLAAAAWGTFAVPDDPSRSGKAPVPIPGALRLVLELGFFGSACWALFDSGAQGAALTLSTSVVILHLVSADRIAWLLRR